MSKRIRRGLLIALALGWTIVNMLFWDQSGLFFFISYLQITLLFLIAARIVSYSPAQKPPFRRIGRRS